MINGLVYIWTGECDSQWNPYLIHQQFPDHTILLIEYCSTYYDKYLIGLNITPWCNFNVSAKLVGYENCEKYHIVTLVE